MTQRFLLDSHVLIWLLYEPERIGKRTANLLQEAEAVLVSSVSFWELALKHGKGKLAYTPQALIEGAGLAGLDILELRPEHSLRLGAIELPHKDPFNAMLLAQAVGEQCVLVTADGNILDTKYHVRDVRT